MKRKEAYDASLQGINGRVDVSATGIFHALHIIVAESWVVGLGMVRLMEIFPMNRDVTLNFKPQTLNRKPRTLNRMDACDASLQGINGRVEVSATSMFHAHRIIVAEGWVMGLSMMQSMEKFPTNRDATLNFEPLTLNPKP